MDWLNYHQLLNFWMVAREGSVLKASERLHVTPATVSIQVRQLEKSLGVKLFEKDGRGLALTEIGEQVSEYASSIFATGNELLEMVRGGPVSKPIVLRVGIRDSMPKLVAYRLLESAFELKDTLRVVCIEGDIQKLVSDIAIHKLDVILSDAPLDPTFRVQSYSHQVGESQIAIAATASLAKKYRKGFPHSLDGAPFVLATENNTLRRSMNLWFHSHQIRPHIRGEFADSAMLKVAGSKGIGLFAVPSIIAKEIQEMYAVETLGIIPDITEKFFAITVERKIKHPAVLRVCNTKLSATDLK